MFSEAEAFLQPSSNEAPEVVAAIWFCTSGAIVLLGVCLGFCYLDTSHHPPPPMSSNGADLSTAFTNWDGQWYLRIARDGYTYNPETRSSVAFFPAFPLASRGLSWAMGLDYATALTLTANGSFFLAMLLFGNYIRQRPNLPSASLPYALPVLALFPVGFFFRMAYSDSIFLMLALLMFYGLVRHWPLLLVAALAGLATATRPVGVALVPPLVLASWRRPGSAGRKLVLLGLISPLSIWGLLAYMGFQYISYREPLAFAKTQAHWHFRDPPNRVEQLKALLTLEPLESVYDESSQAYWRRYDRELLPVFSLQFANPLYFTGISALVGYGLWRRWLSGEEILFALGILLIPYLCRSYEGCMTSQARFASVCFPAYLVLGRLLATLQSQFAAAVLSLSGLLLGIYSALFAGRFFFM